MGHTPVKSCSEDTLISGKAEVKLWFVDTFSLFSSMCPIGDGSMLVVEENESIEVLNESEIGGYEPNMFGCG